MEWYEHLLGTLAIFTCINWIVIMAAIRVGTIADARPADYAKSSVHSYCATSSRQLSKRTSIQLPQQLLQRQSATPSMGISTAIRD